MKVAHPGRVHLAEQHVFGDGIRLLDLMRAARRPWPVRCVRAPDVHLRIDDVHEPTSLSCHGRASGVALAF